MTIVSLTDGINIKSAKQLTVSTKAVTGGTLYIQTLSDDSGPVGVSSNFVATSISAGQVLSAAGVNTAISTVGAGVLTAAGIVGGLITRTGSTAAYTDTTDTGTAIQAAWTNGVSGSSLDFVIKNNTAFAETLAGGTGVTMVGNLIVPANAIAMFRMIWTGTNTVSIYTLNIAEADVMPDQKIATLNATTGSLPAGAITGANNVVLISSNAVPGAQLVRTAAQMLADIPNGKVGTVWRFRICNSGAGTLTLTTDAGTTVTLSGTMTVPTATWREFVGSIDTATTATITAAGQGTYS